jgi:hypothetical protein
VLRKIVPQFNASLAFDTQLNCEGVFWFLRGLKVFWRVGFISVGGTRGVTVLFVFYCLVLARRSGLLIFFVSCVCINELTLLVRTTPRIKIG